MKSSSAVSSRRNARRLARVCPEISRIFKSFRNATRAHGCCQADGANSTRAPRSRGCSSGQRSHIPSNHLDLSGMPRPTGVVFRLSRCGDSYVEGRGAMRVILTGLFPIVNANGPELDHSSAVRFLNEMMWFPSAFLRPNITWTAWMIALPKFVHRLLEDCFCQIVL